MKTPPTTGDGGVTLTKSERILLLDELVVSRLLLWDFVDKTSVIPLNCCSLEEAVTRRTLNLVLKAPHHH